MTSALPRLAALLTLFFLPLSVAFAADSSFAAATEAFAAGDFERALGLFEAAGAQGAEGPAVPYNIGVCRYKLGRYAEAEADFAALGARFPQMRAVADYNRGLALLELDREPDARAAFAAARDGDDAAVARLATTMLARLDEPGAQAPAPRPWFGLFDVGVGHDGNVALIDELSLPAGQSPDSPFAAVLGYAGRSFGGRVPVRLDLSAYAIHYPDASQFDQTSTAAAAAFQLRRGAWSFELGPRYDRSTIDGDGLELELGVTGNAYRSVGERMRFAAVAAFDDVSAPEDRFAFLEGSRRRAGFGIEPRGASTAGFRAAYQLETNDRASRSVTSDRDRVELGYRHGAARWLLDVRVTRRVSRYDDAASRREELTELGVSARRNLGSGWRFSAEYRHADNDSSVAEFSYEADRFAFGLGRAF
jgi:tetratricopeptide (TPR) repeat protein